MHSLFTYSELLDILPVALHAVYNIARDPAYEQGFTIKEVIERGESVIRVQLPGLMVELFFSPQNFGRCTT